MSTTVNIGDDASAVVAAAGATETFNFEAGTHLNDTWTGGQIQAREGDTYVFTGCTVKGVKPPIADTGASYTVTNLAWETLELPVGGR